MRRRTTGGNLQGVIWLKGKKDCRCEEVLKIFEVKKSLGWVETAQVHAPDSVDIESWRGYIDRDSSSLVDPYLNRRVINPCIDCDKQIDRLLCN